MCDLSSSLLELKSLNSSSFNPEALGLVCWEIDYSQIGIKLAYLSKNHQLSNKSTSSHSYFLSVILAIGFILFSTSSITIRNVDEIPTRKTGVLDLLPRMLSFSSFSILFIYSISESFRLIYATGVRFSAGINILYLQLLYRSVTNYYQKTKKFFVLALYILLLIKWANINRIS